MPSWCRLARRCPFSSPSSPSEVPLLSITLAERETQKIAQSLPARPQNRINTGFLSL
jgi:hypothetical protein